ncbi:MAG: ferrous iron transport protein B [Deltaproteobacteria bacterium]|nr:ferrous iron transport protein B [Deltaproteobacteria bacterium]
MSHERKRVVVAGNPNAGKTSLFNALTGSNARTGNYPGITVDRRTGTLAIGSRSVELIDVPGTYALTARSAEEQVAIDEILPNDRVGPDAALFVADAGALSRHLYLATQILESGLPTLLCLNMIDEARALGTRIDTDAMSRELGVPVVAVSARTGEGLPALKDALDRLLEAPSSSTIELALDDTLRERLSTLEKVIDEVWPAPRGFDGKRRDARRAALARWAFLSIGDDELTNVPVALRTAVLQADREDASSATDVPLDERLVTARYAIVDRVVAASVTKADKTTRASERIDAVLTHPVWGLGAFAVVMAALFQALFAWSEPLVGAIETAVAWLQDLARSALPEGPLAELIADGVIAGVGNVVVFVPQIALLSLFIVVLEDSGYLARVAFVIDRVMRGVGLHGRAFVPLLSGFACAVPAVMATRTIESRRDRLVTMLALPLMSCSARLPVYALVVAIVFPPGTRTSIGLEAGAIALLAMYALSVTATLAAAAVMKRTVLKGAPPALLLELPPYRLPQITNVLRTVADRTWQFLANAGTMIAAITIVLWALLSFPRDEVREAALDARAEVASAIASEGERDEALTAIDHERAEARMENSLGGRFGRVMEPAIEPLGFDWKIGIGLLASFAAREVLVGTLGIVYGVGGEADETNDTLRERLRAARRDDGSVLFTPLTGVSLMVFFVLAAQCMSTLAAVKRESGTWRWPLFMLVYMNVLAYVASLIVYQGGRLLGFV